MNSFGAIAIVFTMGMLLVNVAVLEGRVAHLEKQLENQVMVLGSSQ